MKNKIFSFLFVFFCVTVAFSQNKEKTKAPSSYQNTEFHTDYKPNYKNDGLNKPVKNVILLIGDGMGLAQASAGMYANHNTLTIFNLKNIGLIKTFSLSDFITDSAASGTAYATGEKTKNGCIGVDSLGNKLPNMTEILSPLGYATGIVTTDKITGATPSAFYAHQIKRNMTKEIFEDLVNTKALFIAGSNVKDFEKNNTEKLDALKKKNFKVLHDYKNLPLSMEAEKIALICDEMNAKFISEGRDPNYLKETTAQAIKFLSNKSKKGFFLMVEGAQIDWASHNNVIENVVREVLDFDKAVEEALKFADKNGETLVIITADHETGGMSLSNGNIEKGYIKAHFATSGHSPIIVPVYAYGPQAQLFRGVQDNTEIFSKILSALQVKK